MSLDPMKSDQARTINLNNTFKPMLAENALDPSIKSVLIEKLNNFGFAISLLKEDPNPPLLFTVNSVTDKFGSLAANIYNVENISQDHPVNMRIVDDQIRALPKKAFNNLVSAFSSLAVCAASGLGSLFFTKKAFDQFSYGNFISIFKSNAFVRNTSLAAGALGILSVVAGVACVTFSKMYASTNFDLYNRLVSIVSLAERSKGGVVDFNGPLVLSK